MNEKISTLMDGELEQDEAMRAIRHLGSDANRRDLWDQYHLIGDVLRGESSGEIVRRKKSADAIFARLANEPTVLVPAAMKSIPVEKKTRVALALAASIVTVSAIAVVAFKLQADSAVLAPAQLAQANQTSQVNQPFSQPAQADGPLAFATKAATVVTLPPQLQSDGLVPAQSQSSAPDEIRVNDYLAIHRQFTNQSGFQAASVQIESPRRAQQTQQSQQAR